MRKFGDKLKSTKIDGLKKGRKGVLGLKLKRDDWSYAKNTIFLDFNGFVEYDCFPGERGYFILSGFYFILLFPINNFFLKMNFLLILVKEIMEYSQLDP